MKEYHVLNLGAGVQSTMLYLLACQRHECIPHIDVAIFADTGEEPQAVYRHLEWLKGIDGPEIMVRSRGRRLGDALCGWNGVRGANADIPAYTSNGGMLGRRCSGNYKRDVVIKAIREEIVGLKPCQRFPKADVVIHQYLGLSFDEGKRVLRYKISAMNRTPWSVPHFPLWETRTARPVCKRWLKPRVPHRVPRSACTFCPFRLNDEWRDVQSCKQDMERACAVDVGIRDLWPDQGAAYVHRSCVPLAEADLADKGDGQQEFGFVRDCEGMCGT